VGQWSIAKVFWQPADPVASLAEQFLAWIHAEMNHRKLAELRSEA